MTKYRVRGGGEVVLTQSDFVAAGGEGQVFSKGAEAFKVYLKPERMIPERKIAELAGIAAPTVIRPQRVLLDGRGKAVGYSMRRVEGHPLCQLFTRAFRDREGVDDAAVLRLVLDLRGSLAAVHAARVLMVDANEYNFLVARDFREVYCIDVDSYQTPSFPATALMESVRDWQAGGRWTEGSDWFSWGVVTFQMWTGIHPYKGKHPTVCGLAERMQAKISVFHPDVTVPRVVPAWDVIPEGLRAWYRATFEAGHRGAPPAQAQVVAPGTTARPVAVPTQVTLEAVRSFAGTVVEYVARGAVEAAIVAQGRAWEVWSTDGRRAHTEAVPRGGQLAWAPGDVPLYAWVEGARLRLRTLGPAGAEVPVAQAAEALAVVDGQVFVRAGASVVAVDLAALGGALVATGRLVAQVMPLATQLFPGVAIQSVLGAWYANLLGGVGSAQVRLPELDGARVLDARAAGACLLVLAERGGRVDRYVFEVAERVARLRWADRNVGAVALNATILPRGVAALIDEAGDLQIFAARGAQQGRRIGDPAVADLRLARRGDEVLGVRGGDVWRVRA